jgi:hypothetical protein
MLTQDEIQNQIYQFLADKKLTDKERAGFLVAAVDVVRKKFALEVEQALSPEDIKAVEAIADDQQAMAEMVSRWEKNTGKKSEDRIQQIIFEFFDEFLKLQNPPTSSPAPSVG